jgi:hypothetical protein
MISVSSYVPLNIDLMRALKQGKNLVVGETGELRRATWKDSLVRWLNWSQARRQDQEVAEWLIQHLQAAQKSETYSQTLDAIAKYAKACQRTDAVFKRLENTIFAHKCHLQLPSLGIEELIQPNGTPTQNLLLFLKRNQLHYVISKANSEHKATAILINGKEVYIRAKEGKSFLDTPEHIDLILARLPADHADIPLLQKLRNLLIQNLKNQDEIKAIRDQLASSHYIYQSLKNIRTDTKGLLISQSYLADGIENFEHRNWKQLKPNFREKSEQPTYSLRIVTRLPAYALEKTTLGKVKTLLRNLLNFRAHGHSWVELTEPVYDQKGQITPYQNVYNVGYYFNPLDRQKRFESADPMAYMPIPDEQMVVEEVPLTKEQFEQAQLYVREVQGLMKNPRRHLSDKPRNRALSPKQIEDIRYIYKSTLKSTCLTFANVLRETVTGVQVDNRGQLRRWLAPKSYFKKWDRIDTFVEKTLILHWLIRVPRFLLRMELPFWVKEQRSPQAVRPKEVTAS